MVKRFSGPTVIETDDDGNNPVAIFTGPDKREIRSNDADYAAAVVGAAGRVDVLNGATAGQSSAWLRIGPFSERYAYQLDSGSTSTQYAIDISEDGVTSLGQAFTGTWARSDLAYITGLISYSNPRAKYFRVTVISGGPLSFSRGF